jgi:glutathione S-transferase
MPRIENPLSPIVGKLEGIHLFHFDGAPCAQRVRFALAEKGLRRGREVGFDVHTPEACAAEEGAWISRIVSLIKKDHLSATYAQIQPNLVVPALVHDGVLYTESMDIVEYIDDAFGGDRLVPTGDPALVADVRSLTQTGKELHRSIRFVTFRWGLGRLGRLNAKEEEGLRAMLRDTGDEEQLVSFYEGYDKNEIPQSVYVEHLNKLGDAFKALDRRLDDGREFLTGDTLTMADVIWAMKVLRLDECGYPFSKCFPNVHAWFRRIANRPSFRSGVMGKHRAMHTAFRIKAGVEKLLAVGLERVVLKHVA